VWWHTPVIPATSKKPKVGRLWSRLAWAKSETLFINNQSKKGCSNSTVPA
jgi:hypothetical protein